MRTDDGLIAFDDTASTSGFAPERDWLSLRDLDVDDLAPDAGPPSIALGVACASLVVAWAIVRASIRHRALETASRAEPSAPSSPAPDRDTEAHAFVLAVVAFGGAPLVAAALAGLVL